MREDIIAAYRFLREKNSTIPSEVIEFMKDSALEALSKTQIGKECRQPYNNYFGKQVMKVSGKPFKSGQKTNTVKGLIVHPALKVFAFTFEEDDSYVECRQCGNVA